MKKVKKFLSLILRIVTCTVKTILLIIQVGLLLLALGFFAYQFYWIWDTMKKQRLELITPETAALVFTASTVLIGIALSVIVIAWRYYYKATEDIPSGERRLRFNMRRNELFFYLE